MKRCRCYDGPYSSMTPRTLVSVRCPEHRGVRPKPGYSLIFVDESGKVIDFAPREKATPVEKALVTNTKRARTYSTGKRVKK